MFIVTTQGLENYGAHAESGKFADGQNYWKFKSGSTYLVEDLDRAAGCNGIRSRPGYGERHWMERVSMSHPNCNGVGR